MATIKSLEVQKESLYYVLLSRRDGYTNTTHILRDLSNDFGIDGNALAWAHGYHSFHTFLESASMREYCRIVEEPRATTVYYGIVKNRTQHIERNRQISIPYELEMANKGIRKMRQQIETKDAEISKINHNMEKMAKQLKEAEIRLNRVMTSNSNGLNPRRQVGFIQRSDAKTSDILRDPRSIPANLTTKETDTQTECTDQDEKAVQTEDQIQSNSICVTTTLKFLKEQHAKGQAIDRTNPKQLYIDHIDTITPYRQSLSYSDYGGNITVKDMIDQIFCDYFSFDDDIYNYEPHIVRCRDPESRRTVEVSNDTPVVADGEYCIEMNLRGGEVTRQLLQHHQQISEEKQQLKDSWYIQLLGLLDERNVDLYHSEVRNAKLYEALSISELKNSKLLENNRNLEAKLGQPGLDRIKVYLKEFVENAEISSVQDLLNTMSAELETKQKQQSEIVENTKMSPYPDPNLDTIDSEDTVGKTNEDAALVKKH